MPPFYYDCPKCKKRYQQGQLGKHILRYTNVDLAPYIINLDKIEQFGVHPEINCSGRTYVICPKSLTAFEKVGGKLEKNHANCVHKYFDYVIKIKQTPIQEGDHTHTQEQDHTHTQEQHYTHTQEQDHTHTQEQDHTHTQEQDHEHKQEECQDPNIYSPLNKEKLQQLCKGNGIVGYSGKKHQELVNLLTENDRKNKEIPPESICYINLDAHTESVKQSCNCSKQVDVLKAELEIYKKWAKCILSTVPKGLNDDLVEQKVEPVVNKPFANELITNKPIENKPTPNKPTPNKPTPNKPLLVKPTQQKKQAVKASKKEIEKGLWCTKCESCHNTAQFTTDLKPCQKCNKLCHRDNDLYGCYHWDCAVCDKKICKECNKAAGGNKLFSFCSTNCKKQHNP